MNSWLSGFVANNLLLTKEWMNKRYCHNNNDVTNDNDDDDDVEETNVSARG